MNETNLMPFLGQPTERKQRNLCQELATLVESIYIPYKGYLIEKTDVCFIVFNQRVQTLGEAQYIIDNKKQETTFLLQNHIF